MSSAKTWLFRLLLLGFIALTTIGLWLPPIVTHAVEKDYHFPEVVIDATVMPNGDLVLEETRTFDFQNGPFTYAYFNVDDPLDHVRDFTIAERLDDGSEVPVTPDYASHSIVTEGFQAQWSYEAEDETRTWVFRYRVACAVDAYTDTAPVLAVHRQRVGQADAARGGHRPPAGPPGWRCTQAAGM